MTDRTKTERLIRDLLHRYYDAYGSRIPDQTSAAVQRTWRYTELTSPPITGATSPHLDTQDAARVPHVSELLRDITARSHVPRKVQVHADPALRTPALTRDRDRGRGCDSNHPQATTPAETISADDRGDALTPLLFSVHGFSVDPVRQLYRILTEDLGFQEVTVIFDGGCGYTVVVRDGSVLQLTQRERHGIAAYVRGEIDPESVTARKQIERGSERVEHVMITGDGWGERIKHRCGTLADTVVRVTPGTTAWLDVVRDIASRSRVSRATAARAADTIRSNPSMFKSGVVDLDPAVYKVACGVARRVLNEDSVEAYLQPGKVEWYAAPGSVNAATGLQVTRVTAGELETGEWNPFIHAAVEWSTVSGVPDSLPIAVSDDTPSELPVIAPRTASVTVDTEIPATGISVDAGVIRVSPEEVLSVPTGTALYACSHGYAEIPSEYDYLTWGEIDETGVKP